MHIRSMGVTRQVDAEPPQFRVACCAIGAAGFLRGLNREVDRKDKRMPTQSRNSICDKGLAGVSVLIQQQKISPVEVATECLDRIRHLQPSLNAFITLLPE